MLKSEMQHQFWITKKMFQRKLGSKEDEYIISSDATLDSKIEIFKSISQTSSIVTKIIDQYQERLCVLSQEESTFGRFLKEFGKKSKTTGPTILNSGKAVSYSGQQRMTVRLPLLRLRHDVEVFRFRAVSDTLLTINAMEKDRTEYRAALSWMKSSSSELDPDTGKGLDKFRMAQSHVRNAKKNFDSISLDSIQKIDLLAAARCNMYSVALVSYMSDLLQFSKKSANTFEAISKALLKNPRYDFNILKDLSYNEEKAGLHSIDSIDKDQTLFFSDEFTDVENEEMKTDTDVSNYHQSVTGSTDFWSNFISNMEHSDTNIKESSNTDSHMSNAKNMNNNITSKSSNVHTWMSLFAEFDPLENPEFDLQLNVGVQNVQQT